MLLKTYISAQLFLAAWAATVPTPTVTGIFNFTSLIDMVVNISSPTVSSSSVSDIKPEPACRLQEIAGCFSTTAPRFYTAVINIYRRDTRMSICGIADYFNTCAVPYKQKCSSAETLSFDIFTGLIQYLCTEQGYNDYLSLVPCVSNPEVTTEINKCVDNFPSPLRWDDLCRLPDDYTSCVINATRGYCEGTSADMLRQTLNTILYPLKIATCQNRPSPTDNTKNAVQAREVDAQAIIEPAFSLKIAEAPSTGASDKERPSILTTLTDAATTTLPSLEIPTVVVDGSVTPTSPQEFSIDAKTTAVSREFSIATVDATDRATSSREFSTASTGISASRSVDTVSPAPIEVTTIEASPREFSTAFLQVTAVQTLQGSQGELSTEATLEATPSGLSSENLRTELPRTNTFQKVSENVSTSQLQTSTVQTLVEYPQPTAVGFASSSLATQDGTVSVIVPQATSSLDIFTTAVSDNRALKLSTKSFSTSVLDITIPEISEQFSTVALNIETSQVTTGNIPAQTADVTVTETPVSRFATFASDIRVPGDSSREFVPESTAVAEASVFSEQFSTAALAISTSKVLSEGFSSRIPSEQFSSFVPDIGLTVISSEIFPTATYDDRTIEAPATTTPVKLTSKTEILTMSLAGTTPYSKIPTNLDLSTSASEINTIYKDGKTIPTTELSTIFQEMSTNLPIEVSLIASEYISSAQDLKTTLTAGTTLYPSLGNHLTTVRQESSTEYTPLVEGTSITIVREASISPSSFEASSVTTQELQISPTSVDYLPTATADIATTQTSSQATTTTSAPPTTTFASKTTLDFKTSPLKCYECHSGAPGSWQNVNCPPDGRIKKWAVTTKLCHGPCVSMVSRYPAGDVYRACSTNYYFPKPPPSEGCIKEDQGVFCFCSTNFCNTRNMTKEQKDYIQPPNFQISI
ncbi:unnamed protein product [Candidula unifasciata]|uniref:Uncharacterized protein n=1 Tax=Candidula unifasciata TaxID=100452 RepID=A0A8S4A724_9EUPU|nr:unnamed protein product [Candidula unifasciata]